MACLACESKTPEIRIGLVGLDTSHVPTYLTLFNERGTAGHVPGGRIVGAFKGGSPEIEASRTRIDRFTREAVDKYGVRLCESIAELTHDMDAIMILSVDGRQHLDQFRYAAGMGKPVFIDKPMGGSLRDAVGIARLAQQTQTPCFSSSSFRFLPDSPLRQLDKIGQVTAAFSYGPAEREPHHPDLFWYGIHPVEALYTVLGPGCRQVIRASSEHTDVVIGVWANGCIGTLQGNRRSFRHGVTIVGTQGAASGGEEHSYRPLAAEIMHFFRTRVPPVPMSVTLEIHAFMEAADESKRQAGAPVALADVLARAGYLHRVVKDRQETMRPVSASRK